MSYSDPRKKLNSPKFSLTNKMPRQHPIQMPSGHNFYLIRAIISDSHRCARFLSRFIFIFGKKRTSTRVCRWAHNLTRPHGPLCSLSYGSCVTCSRCISAPKQNIVSIICGIVHHFCSPAGSHLQRINKRQTIVFSILYSFVDQQLLVFVKRFDCYNYTQSP